MDESLFPSSRPGLTLRPMIQSDQGRGWCVTGTRSRQNDKHLQYLQPRETSSSVHTTHSHNWEDVNCKIWVSRHKNIWPKDSEKYLGCPSSQSSPFHSTYILLRPISGQIPMTGISLQDCSYRQNEFGVNFYWIIHTKPQNSSSSRNFLVLCQNFWSVRWPPASAKPT